jgi:hypothetical protein
MYAAVFGFALAVFHVVKMSKYQPTGSGIFDPFRKQSGVESFE